MEEMDSKRTYVSNPGQHMIAFHDNEYLDLVEYVIDHGKWKQNRTGEMTKSVFGVQMRFDLSDGTIPLLTTKEMYIPAIIHEILWYLQGTGDISYLQKHKVRIWNEWANEDNNLGPIYGVAWRKWLSHDAEGGYIDQISELIHNIKNNPDSRRLLVSAWQVADLPNESYSPQQNVNNGKMALAPCHYSFQCYVSEGTLSMLLNQRSCDVGLGVPFNIVQYSILLRMLAEVTNLKPGELVWNGGDVHVYEDHVPLLSQQITRDPFPSPKLVINRSISDIDDFKFEDIVIVGYNNYHPRIPMKVAI